ncbi:unnamed protein product, partial [Ilex paraguariensis]
TRSGLLVTWTRGMTRGIWSNRGIELLDSELVVCQAELGLRWTLGPLASLAFFLVAQFAI